MSVTFAMIQLLDTKLLVLLNYGSRITAIFDIFQPPADKNQANQMSQVPRFRFLRAESCLDVYNKGRRNSSCKIVVT